MGHIDNEISVDANGNFKYEHALLNLPAGQQIRWHSKLQFTIAFPGGKPFNTVDLYATACKPAPGWEALSGPATADPGVYHYHVAVLREDDRNRIFMDSGCPGVKV